MPQPESQLNVFILAFRFLKMSDLTTGEFSLYSPLNPSHSITGYLISHYSKN